MPRPPTTNWPGTYKSGKRNWTRNGRSWEKKEANCRPDDPADKALGDCWDHVVLNAETKFAVAVVSGKRTLAKVRQQVGELARRSDYRLPRLITSDEYKPYRRVLLEVYGESRPR